ncbi:MAG: AAA domain-containing protein [Thermogemmata sp.]|nr:AAA domain-containing protein [Thermogemmata sp.]
MSDKGKSLLNFLRAFGTLKRGRVHSYGQEDKILYLADLPEECDEIRSPFSSNRTSSSDSSWLEVRKKRKPTRPQLPSILIEWVNENDLDQPHHEPKVSPEITVLVEQEVPDPAAPTGIARTITQQIPEHRKLSDHPNVKKAWNDYLTKKWKPWAQEMRLWEEVQKIYESLDFMRRRLEEAEERYELILGVGLLQWYDPTGARVERHVLTAPAELALDAARGKLTVMPAVSFDGFRIELDMLELQHRPQLNNDKLNELLEELDIQVWKFDLVAPILYEIANGLNAKAQVEDELKPANRVENYPRFLFAPAIILRQRRSNAYEDLIDNFLNVITKEKGEGTLPWHRFIDEGEYSITWPRDGSTGGEGQLSKEVANERLLFPLPTNEEQRQIARRLETHSCVLVKGPPGTGKSHTIANLICHLLAKGHRVLVTAHAPKALAVLRDLLPREMRDLCVTALSASREDQRLLEESVRGILNRKNRWCGRDEAQKAIEEVECELSKLEAERAQIERDLRVFREAETHRHELAGGYRGTAAQIARLINEQEPEYSWFPEISPVSEFPLDAADVAFLAEAHQRFTTETCAELQLEIGEGLIPDPQDFSKQVNQLIAARQKEQQLRSGVERTKVEFLMPVATDQLHKLEQVLREFENRLVRSKQVLRQASESILRDLLASADSIWLSRVSESKCLLSDVKWLLESINSTWVAIPRNIPEHKLAIDVKRRLAHLESGGLLRILMFAPKVIRETDYLVAACGLSKNKANQIEQLRCLHNHLELQHKIRELRQIWSEMMEDVSDYRQVIMRSEEIISELQQWIMFFKSESSVPIINLLGSNRTDLASINGCIEWRKAIQVTLLLKKIYEIEKKYIELVKYIWGMAQGRNIHPCLYDLHQAALKCDVNAWSAAWRMRERLREEKRQLARYESLLSKLNESSPALVELLRKTAGDPIWQARVRKLQEAWNWAVARAWVRRFSDMRAYEARVQDYHHVQKRIEKTIENLVALRAWKMFFDRLDEKTVQSLNAWVKAMDRIGKGTGKHANRHRRTARQYLLQCVPSIPAWIMSLHRLWDSVDAVPGLFDTVIVDEASQAGVEALILLLLAKRIVVVGDDKQNSPEAVGIREDDIARLAREHLHSFRFRDEFRPDASLFDHAERTFGTQITLREHFRCVPEIIRFSNELCYRDAPLIPLRQVPADRLAPLRSRFIPTGLCEGEGARIRNRAEAEAVVETVVTLVDDPAYQGKTMGIIALQGHAQAQLIENLLAQKLDPKIITDRRLRCGEPATFQGDQRDVIFLSMVIAPNIDYRALTRLPDQRRFNVAMSRARDQVWLFHSVQLHDLMPEDLRYRLISFFENPHSGAVEVFWESLERLERATHGFRRHGTQPEPYDSWFEVDVALELLRRNYRVRPQIEVAGYRIDLVVEGLDARIGIECDGDSWHGPEQYERDMSRQRRLERAGWTFVRVRESDFYIDRERAISVIMEACEKLGIRPLSANLS